jgi:hypothetical protein
MVKPDLLTDDQLDEMTQVSRIAYYRSCNFGHNAAIRIGCAPNRGQRAFEIRMAAGERAAAMSVDPNEFTKERDGAREDAIMEQRRQEAPI